MPTDMTILGWNLRTFETVDEPRISENELADKLKCPRRTLRRTANRLREEGILNDFNTYTETCVAPKKHGPKTIEVWWFNDQAACEIILDTRTARGRAIRKEVVDVYLEVRRGAAPPWMQPLVQQLAATNALIARFVEAVPLLGSGSGGGSGRSGPVTEEERKRLLRLAKEVGHRRGETATLVWRGVAKAEGYEPKGPAFSTVFACDFERIVDVLKGMRAEKAVEKTEAPTTTTPVETPSPRRRFETMTASDDPAVSRLNVGHATTRINAVLSEADWAGGWRRVSRDLVSFTELDLSHNVSTPTLKNQTPLLYAAFGIVPRLQPKDGKLKSPGRRPAYLDEETCDELIRRILKNPDLARGVLGVIEEKRTNATNGRHRRVNTQRLRF